MIESKLVSPVFIVGCPRSGTTLLQSLLAAHPDIASFPESKFFEYLVPEHEPRRRALGLASRRLLPMLDKFFTEIGYPQMSQQFPRIPFFMRQYAKIFIHCLNQITLEQGKQLWLDKTPEHLRYLYWIEKYLENPKIIHLIRNGSDVVASLYEMGQKYQQWRYTFKDIDSCIDHWLADIKLSQIYLEKPNHYLVKYEEIVQNPGGVLEPLCQFIGIEFLPQMLEDYQETAKQLIRERETWKGGVSGEIKNANSTKFYQLFNQSEQEYILQRLNVEVS